MLIHLLKCKSALSLTQLKDATRHSRSRFFVSRVRVRWCRYMAQLLVEVNLGGLLGTRIIHIAYHAICYPTWLIMAYITPSSPRQEPGRRYRAFGRLTMSSRCVDRSGGALQYVLRKTSGRFPNLSCWLDVSAHQLPSLTSTANDSNHNTFNS